MYYRNAVLLSCLNLCGEFDYGWDRCSKLSASSYWEHWVGPTHSTWNSNKCLTAAKCSWQRLQTSPAAWCQLSLRGNAAAAPKAESLPAVLGRVWTHKPRAELREGKENRSRAPYHPQPPLLRHNHHLPASYLLQMQVQAHQGARWDCRKHLWKQSIFL